MSDATPCYHGPGDRAFLKNLRQAAPTEFSAYQSLSAVVGREDGAVPVKYRELIALGVALTTQCAYCLESHTAAARKAGVTEEELAETVHIVAALRAGAGFAHGMLAMKLFTE